MKYFKTVRGAVAILLAILSFGCSAHNPFIISDTTETIPASNVTFMPHSDKVFVTSESIASDRYDLIGSIEVGKIWYGASSDVLLSMATRARELGADAVIEAKTWRQPSGFSWSAPHGSGKAVRLKNRTEIDFRNLKGDWL